MGTTIIICSLGALLGLLFALFANLVVLPWVLASLETYEGASTASCVTSLAWCIDA